MDFLKSAVASAISKGPLGAYTVQDRVDLDASIWTLNNAIKRENSQACTIFTFDISAQKSRLPIARNALRKWRTLHHPNVVKVIDAIETETHIYIVTERLIPLGWHTRRKSLGEETLKWGLCSIAKAVKFINEEASSIHGCVRTSSVFTAESGEWKLAGFELLSSVSDDQAVVYTQAALVPDSGKFAPPEVGRGGWDAVRKNPTPAVDSYGFGTLVYESFNGSYPGPDQLVRPGNVPPTMQANYKRLINANPKVRLSVAHFYEQGRRSGGFFDSPLITLTENIESIGLMSDGEREDFLSHVNEMGDDLPEDFMKRKILPELLKSVEFGGGGPKCLDAILHIGTKLTNDEYEAQLTPALVRLFSSSDRALRVCLLDKLPLMIDHFPQKVVNDKIFPNLTTGFTDVAPVVREQTVKSVLIVVPKLADRVINGELLKHLAKTANDAEPGIRTNTTICLGKIAKHINATTRSKVLIAAFTRAIRDPFVHARSAGLMALAATSDMFGEEDCANKVLPAICPALIDKQKLVRDQANKALEQYLQRVRKHAQSLPDAGPEGATGMVKPPVTSTVAAASDNSWAGWAISSFTNKLATAHGELQSRSNGTALSPGLNGTSGRPSSVPAARALASPTAGTASGPPSSRPSLTSNNSETGRIAASFKTSAAIAQADTDDWGGFDNEGDAADDWGAGNSWGGLDDDIDDEPNSDGAVSPVVEHSKQASISTGAAASSKANFDDEGEPDFAGWLKAKSTSTKAVGKPLPKGLGNSKSTASVRPGATKTTGSNNASVGAKSTQSKATTVPAPAEEDPDDWGDAWA